MRKWENTAGTLPSGRSPECLAGRGGGHGFSELTLSSGLILSLQGFKDFSHNFLSHVFYQKEKKNLAIKSKFKSHIYSSETMLASKLPLIL